MEKLKDCIIGKYNIIRIWKIGIVEGWNIG
jgi:hypothetical protein